MKIVVLEGARGAGKSTIIRKLRDAMVNTVAFNLTGNKTDSEEGKEAVFNHFSNVLRYFEFEAFDETPFNYLLDRAFYSEMVYSSLYKSYDFSDKYSKLLNRLERISDRNEIVVIHLTTSEKDFARNLGRSGKAHLFGDAKYADDVYKSIEQDAKYIELFEEAKKRNSKIVYKTADLSNLTIEEAVTYVKSLI